MESCLPISKPLQPVTTQSPLTRSPKCSLSIPIMQLRKHSFTCSSIEVNDSDSSDGKEFGRSVIDDRVLSDACKTSQQASYEIESVIARE